MDMRDKSAGLRAHSIWRAGFVPQELVGAVSLVERLLNAERFNTTGTKKESETELVFKNLCWQRRLISDVIFLLSSVISYKRTSFKCLKD